MGEFSQRRHGWLERHAGLTIFILGLALFVFIGTVPLSIELYKFWRYDNGPAQTMKSCQVVGSNVVQPGGTLQTTCLYTKRKRCIGTVEYRLIGVSSDTGKQIMDIIGNYKAAWPGGVDVVQNQNIRIPKDVRPGRYTMRWFADYTHCPAADGRKETSPNWRWRDKSPALIIDVVAPAPHQLDWSADAIE